MFMNIIFNETLEIVSLKVGLHELGLLIHKIKQAIITWVHCNRPGHQKLIPPLKRISDNIT